MAGLGFEETELRLGLPGGGSDAAGDAAAARKRGFEETIDLKLKLEQPASSAAAASTRKQRRTMRPRRRRRRPMSSPPRRRQHPPPLAEVTI